MSNSYVESRDGNYFIQDTRVSLDSIVYGYLSGDSPETIRDSFPAVSSEQVYGGIAYYLANRNEIDAYLSAKRQAFEEARRAQTHISPELRARLDQARELVGQP